MIEARSNIHHAIVTMTPPDQHDVATLLVGKNLEHVEHLDYQWEFVLSGGTVISAESEWRLVDNGRIRVTSGDDGHLFGLGSPVAAASVVLEAVGGRTICTVTVALGDLNLDFGDGLALQVLQLSSGYEAWHVFDKDTTIHCLGGGDLAIEVPAPAP